MSLFHRPLNLVAPRLSLALGALLCIASPGGGLAASAGDSAWVASNNSKVRLVSGTVDIDGKPSTIAGVQLRMEPGWKTYWRNPGDSGVPPSFDFKGSNNLKQAEVLYPAPHRFADADGTAIGYDDEVVFPVKITPERDGEAVELKLAFEYGLCKDLCIPNEVSLDLVLAPECRQGRRDVARERARARAESRLRRARYLRLLLSRRTSMRRNPRSSSMRSFPPDARGTDLFIDGGETFVPVPKPLAPLADGKQSFVVSFGSAAEAAAIKGKPLTLTLVSDRGSTETTWTAK